MLANGSPMQAQPVSAEDERMTSPSPMHDPQSSCEGQGPVVSLWSCFNCRKRKSRCDRQEPCTFCSRAGLECSYPSTGRMPTRQHNRDMASVAPSNRLLPRKPPARHLSELHGRLRQLERVVEGMTIPGRDAQSNSCQTILRSSSRSRNRISSKANPDRLSVDEAATDPFDDDSHKLSTSFGSLHIANGGSLYTGNGFWASLHGQLRSFREAFEASEIFGLKDQYDSPFDQELDSDPAPFTLGQSIRLCSPTYPAPHLISYLWKVYVENVDPLVKVLHVPTMNEAIRLAQGSFDKLSAAEQALVFSISLAAVVSLGDIEVQKAFGYDREKVLRRFLVGTELALSRVNILKNAELCVVQANLIYLESVQHRYGMRTIWMMSGVLVRAALSIGLHRDGSIFPNITFFEAEMRRRLWWHIHCLDARLSQCYAPEAMISNDVMDTREPTNVNDADLQVDMTKEPVAREGFTDVSFTLLACELRRQSNHVISAMQDLVGIGKKQQEALKEALRRIDKSREWASTKVFAASEPKHAIKPFVEFAFNLLLDQLEIMARDTNIFGKWTLPGKKEPRDQSFLSASSLLENMWTWQEDASSRQWSWLLVNYKQWYAVAVILIHIQTQAWNSTCERAWMLALKTLNDIPPAMMTQNPLRQSIVSMVAAARRHREEELVRLESEAHLRGSTLPAFNMSEDVPADPSSGPADAVRSAFLQEIPLGIEAQGDKPLEYVDVASINIMENDPYQRFVGLDGMHPDFSCPPWYIEPPSDVRISKSSFGQESDFYNLTGGGGTDQPTAPEGSDGWSQDLFFRV